MLRESLPDASSRRCVWSGGHKTRRVVRLANETGLLRAVAWDRRMGAKGNNAGIFMDGRLKAALAFPALVRFQQMQQVAAIPLT
ncbi:hypothetical protein AVEN_163800-1 [Araneus ventricosus]|uniref:Uncharacterized protein n=1 Tax=Araneus ventricosus TaxID=182803 RepID=A0A4Y2TYK7_ARAVE|nr:hypothetical protein AVEN_163800-1 [Araneus ventricosus]